MRAVFMSQSGCTQEATPTLDLTRVATPSSPSILLSIRVWPPKISDWAPLSNCDFRRIHSSWEEFRFAQSNLRLLPDEELPYIARVNEFYIHGENSQYIDSDSILHVATRFPRLKKLAFAYNDKPYTFVDDRQERRILHGSSPTNKVTPQFR